MRPLPPRFLTAKQGVVARIARELVALCASSGPIDLGQTLVVLPVSRARRLLEGELVDRAADTRRLLVPPACTTPGGVARSLLGSRADRIAGGSAYALAWRSALTQNPELLQHFVVGGSTEARAVRRVAAGLDRTRRSLASAGVTFAQARDECGPGGVRDRLHAAAQLHGHVIACLAEMGLRDEMQAVCDTQPDVLAAGISRVVVASLFDMPPVARELLERSSAEVLPLVNDAPERANLYDAFGIPAIDGWDRIHLQLRCDQLRFAGATSDAAMAAWECVAEMQPPPGPRGVTIGVIDEATASELTRVADEHAVRTRVASGASVAQTAVASLISSIADFLDDPTLSTFGALLRAPDFERYLHAQMRSSKGWWLPMLDAYAERAQADVSLPHNPDWFGASEKQADALGRVWSRVRELLAPLAERGHAPAAEHAQVVADVLQRIYSERTFGEFDEGQRRSAHALRCTAAELRAIAALDQGAATRCTAGEVVRLVLDSISGQRVPPEIEGAAVEVLGWLELATDPADVCIVCDAAEGSLPTRLPVDPLLPAPVRARLGLPTDAALAARDAAILDLLARTKQTLRVVVPSEQETGEPQLPSRLIFRCADDDVLRRLDRALQDEAEPARGVRLEPVSKRPAEVLAFEPRRIVEAPVPDRFSVTAFRDYLASPFTFYVKRVLRLREVEQPRGELSAGGFGDLVHEALRVFEHEPELCTATDPQAIADRLSVAAQDVVRDRYGSSPSATLILQLTQARERLRAFAVQQAAWAEKGWRIRYTEWSPGEDGVEFDVDGQPVRLVGRVDRIDINERTGGYAIIDYKTAKDPKPPESTHVGRDGWKDLQLPLYRTLARSLGVGDAPALAYAQLPADTGKTKFAVAKWGPEELDEAEETARGIIRCVRNGWFDDEGARPEREGLIGILGGYGVLADELPEGHE